ncbi:hypothetical protein EUX98_g9301 [Antrodiella citrinella]|uniref:Uncharacterized protein n=1 Tax=Antrodiella citrinella TaxID=2447956 RepID=A0A4S4LV65_9APHY|nr:hypothetical protein EUX98_g9301 [Antrodiella citrinella]
MLGRSTRRVVRSSSPESPTPHAFGLELPETYSAPELSDDLGFDDSMPMTFKRCLKMGILTGGGTGPTMFDDVIASSTRDLTRTEQVYRPDQQLQWVSSFRSFMYFAKQEVYKHPLFSTFLNRKIDPANKNDVKLRQSIHPSSTGSGAPYIMHSEADTTSLLNVKLVFPAVNILQYVMQQETSEVLPSLPYVASSHGKRGRGTPDAILMYNGEVCGIAEWKTANALPSSVLTEVVDSLSEVELSNVDVPVRFWWGNEDEHSNAVFRKVMCQIHGQMQSRPNVKVACLSSFDITIFIHRHPEEPNFLYVSEPIPSDSVSVMDFLAMFALGLGITELKPEHFPRINYDNWHCLINYYDRFPQVRSGLDVRRDELATILREHRATLDYEAGLRSHHDDTLFSEADQTVSRKRKRLATTTPPNKRRTWKARTIPDDEDTEDDDENEEEEDTQTTPKARPLTQVGMPFDRSLG